MFQWADGGSLRDFWEENPHPKLTPSFIREIVEQLRGLADALNELHHYDGGSYRHGDLKPENILRFRLTKDKTEVGLLKISDMGLAKHHAVATYLRPPTSTRYGTVRYEPPEIVTQRLSDSGRSRLYDCWSMGCITLELIVWLLYGYKRLKDFNEGLKGQMQESSPYFEVKTKNGVQVADVHPSVRQFMEHISQDPECVGATIVGTAVGDLLDIVRTKLLVIPLPQHRESFRPSNGYESTQRKIAVTRADSDEVPVGLGGRATSQQFCNALKRMLEKGKGNDRYWSTGTKRDGIQGPRPIPSINAQDSFLSPIAALRPKGLGPLPERKKENGSLALPPQLAPGPPAQTHNVSSSHDRHITLMTLSLCLRRSSRYIYGNMPSNHSDLFHRK